LCLNILKAEPVLRLLTAHAGWENGEFNLEEGWEVFRVFSRLPASVEDGGSTFQVVESAADPNTLEVFFGRQLNGRFRSGHPDIRIVGMHFVLHPPDPGDEPPSASVGANGNEFWSSDFSDIEEFFGVVEESTAFRVAQSRSLMSAVFFTQELDEEAEEG